MVNATLLDSTEPISMEALPALFQANDFSTMVSRYSNWDVPLEKDALYMKARAHFRDAWNKEDGIRFYQYVQSFCRKKTSRRRLPMKLRASLPMQFPVLKPVEYLRGR